MNFVLITAGGIGSRMHMEIPKQFLNVYDKPIIIYTLEAFQKHPNIDGIGVVCLEGWQDILNAYIKQFGITKVKWIVKGGATGQESIRNGLNRLAEDCDDNDTVLVHDGNRPLVTQETISDCIIKCHQYGSAVTIIPCTTSVLQKSKMEDRESNIALDRDMLAMTQTPHAFPFKKLWWAHQEAEKRGITNSVASHALLIDLGETIHFSLGNETNIKITNTNDLKIFKALLTSGNERDLP